MVKLSVCMRGLLMQTLYDSQLVSCSFTEIPVLTVVR
jgi:hypothetical protein